MGTDLFSARGTKLAVFQPRKIDLSPFLYDAKTALGLLLAGRRLERS
jgi:hypothetical protein